MLRLLLPITMLLLAMPLSTAAQSSTSPRRPAGFDLQGHRGARGLRPENTWPAFRRALALGVPTLELDVVISADSQVVVSHEPWMSSTICTQPNGAPVPVGSEERFNLYQMPYEEIARFDCGRRGHPDFPEQEAMPAQKPLLRTVIQRAEQYAARHEQGPVFYNIETKSRPEWDGQYHPEPARFVKLLVDVLQDTGVTARTTIQSFDPRTLRVVHQMDLPVRTALLVGRLGGSFAENVEQLGFTPDIYSPDYHKVDPQLVEQAHERGVAVIPWTVNDRATMEKLKQMGVDGLITDYPNRGLFLLSE